MSQAGTSRNEEDDGGYISMSKSYVKVRRPTEEDQQEEDLIDVKKEEKEIIRLTKLIEPDYLGQIPDNQLTEAHLKSAISESHLNLRTLKRPLEFLESVAVDLLEFTHSNSHTNDDQSHNHNPSILNDLDSHVRDLIQDIKFIEFSKDTFEEFRENLSLSNHHRQNNNKNKNLDFHLQICKKLSSQLSKWNSLTLRQKFSQDQSYKDFRQRIWEASGSDGIMPHLKTFLPAEEGEESEESSGEELEVAGGRENYKCPLCLGLLTEAVRSKICNHTFCKRCFEGYLEQNQFEDPPCPNSGCSKLLNSHLVAVDLSMATKIRQFRRRQQLRLDAHDVFADELSSHDPFNNELGSKPSTQPLNKSNSTQKRRRVIVDDD